MHGLTVLLVLSLILPGLCITPADYGFTANDDGTFSKEVGDTDGRGSFFIVMRIDGNGKAYYNIDGDVGKDVAVTRNNHYVVANRPYPIYGWDVPEPSVTGPVTGYAAAKTGWGATVDTTGRIQGTFNTGNYGKNSRQNSLSAPSSQKSGWNLQDETRTTDSNYYSVTVQRDSTGVQCIDFVTLKGARMMPTSAIQDDLQPKCNVGVARPVYLDGDDMLVGGVEQNFCVYGHVGFANRLIVMQDGSWMVKTYSREKSKESYMNTGTCEKVKQLIKDIEKALANPTLPRTSVEDSQEQLKQLVKMIAAGSPGRSPAEFGFTPNGDGSYSKKISMRNGRGSTTLYMKVNGMGEAEFSIPLDSNGNALGTRKGKIFVVGNVNYPLYGWQVPGVTSSQSSVPVSAAQSGNANAGNYGQNTKPNLPLAPTYQNVKPNLNLAPTYQNSKPNVPLASSFKNSGANVAIVPIGQPFNGKYYTVDIRRERKVGQCTDRIVIRGVTIMPTSAILAEFQPQCEDGARKFRADGEELLVGGVEQNLCVYGHIDLPKQLVVIENGNCVIKNYDGMNKKVDDLNTDICVKVKELVENIQYALENPAIVRNGVAQNNEQQLNELVKMAVSGRGHSPVDFGFAANRDGSYSKQVAMRDALGFYFLIMTIDRAGKADFRLGNGYSKDVGTIRGNYYELGDTAFPIYGWQVPSVKQSGPSALNTRPMTGNNNAGSYYGDAFPESRFSDGAPLVFSPEYITSDARENVDYGTVFNVRIIQYSGNNGGCEEEVMIVSKDKSLKKTLYTQCLVNGKIRTIRNADQLVLIGGPEEIFFAFTTNKKDIFYIRGGKWRKGDLRQVDVVNDQFMQPREMAQVKERIKKWLDFFNKADKEIERIKGLKDIETNKSQIQIEAFKNVVVQAKVNYDKDKQRIENLRNVAKNTYDLAIQKVRETENTRGWSLVTDNQEKQAETILNMREKELDEMDRKEYNKYGVICNTFNNKIVKEETRCERELDRLDGTIDEENARVTRQVKQNILQGW